jgi:hypothetical protein
MVSDPRKDPELITLYAGVGECLSAWSTVEHTLASLFMSLMVGGDRNQTASVFGAVISFETRLDMLTSVIERDSDAAFRTCWNALKNKIGKLYRKRHQVAHFSIVWDGQREIHELIPFLTAGSSPLQSPLTSNDLKIRAQSFHRAGYRIRNLVNYILHRQGMPVAETPPGGDPARWLQNPFAGAQTPKEI